MSETVQHHEVCRCGARLTVLVARSINGARHPQLREAVLQGKLHRYQCSACGSELVLDHQFLYVDFERRQFLAVYPLRDLAQAEPRAREAAQVYDELLVSNPPVPLAHLKHRFLVRVCFGVDELREKLLVDDAGLSDLALEELKCQVLPAHPEFRSSEVVTLWLVGMDDRFFHFLPAALHPVDDRPPPPRGISIERTLYDEIAAWGTEEILRRRPRLASGPHVSLLRMVPWVEVSPPTLPGPSLL